MTSFSDLSGWAGRILENLSDTGTPTGRVVTWMTSNLYKLNIVLDTGYSVSGEYIVPEFTTNVSGMYEEMYYCDYWNKKANEMLGAASYDWVEMEGADQGRIRKVSRNDTAKTYMSLAKDCRERLTSLISWYMGNQYPITPDQVLFNDRIGGAEWGLLFPPSCDYSSHNTIWSV